MLEMGHERGEPCGMKLESGDNGRQDGEKAGHFTFLGMARLHRWLTMSKDQIHIENLYSSLRHLPICRCYAIYT